MTSERSTYNILVFDDDRDYRALVKTYLNKYLENASVTEYDPVANGVPGEDFDWSAFDVLILDYYLCIYGTTGLDLLHKFHQKKNFPAVIMLTGAADQDTAVNALDSGVSAFLRKEKLDKTELVEAIKSAKEKHAASREQQDELQEADQSFDKSVFYKRLGKRSLKGDPEPVFLYLDIDNFRDHVKNHGVIVSTNLLRHVARETFRFFRERKKIINITRISQSSLGLLVDHSGTTGELESLLQALCDYLAKHEYAEDDQNIPFSVSIGVRILSTNTEDRAALVMQLKQARNQARQSAHNSFCIYTEEHADEAEPEDRTDIAATGSKYDISIDQDALDENDRDIKRALDQNRGVKWFHPVVSTAMESSDASPLIMRVAVGMIDESGNTVSPEEFAERIRSGSIQQYVDRWILQETFSRILNNRKAGSEITYMVRMSESWLGDISLFNWLKEILSKPDKQEPGRNIILSVSTDLVKAHKTRALALLTSLRKTWKFQVALSGVSITDESTWPENLVRAEYGIIPAEEILEFPEFSTNPARLLGNIKTLKKSGMDLIVDGIRNSTMLTDVISFQADHVMGPFIDESQNDFTTMERIKSL